jgi:aconitate hydratase
MPIKSKNSLGSLSELSVGKSSYKYFDLNIAASKIGLDLTRLPYAHRVLFENVLRIEDGVEVRSETFKSFPEWLINKRSDAEVPFMPSRVLMQDFTGVPAIVDLAAMRDAMKNLGGDVKKINPLIPVDLVIDHSVQIDHYGSANSLSLNTDLEMERNRERYEFLRWGQETFENFRVVPPGTGICHQVNLEYLAQVVWTNKEGYAYPDSLVGTDSHTTMVNGLAVLGWGVGGIEAEAAMLGQPLPMILPEVIGFKLMGKHKEGITATDIVLTVTQMLRKRGVVGKFVEFFGDGLDHLSLADRATIANMAPEYGATCGFFPVDDKTIEYLELTARDKDRIELVREYSKKQKLFRNPADKVEYTDILELDLSSVEACLAGPKRPQDRINLSAVAASFAKDLPTLTSHDANFEKSWDVIARSSSDEATSFSLKQGNVVIAAITSCTNTSNPSVMIAAGIVAKKANALGLKSKPWVKTSLAPGSKVVQEYLDANNLSKDLDAIGFNITGFGCTTCIGNSGPLKPEIEESISKNDLTVVSVLSGNRNFEGRVHPLVKANYLASPPLVVAYALAGNINIDISKDPVGKDKNGKDVFLKDIWPTDDEIKACIDGVITPEMFGKKYADVFAGDAPWQGLEITKSETYHWDKNSTYINNPPYFVGMGSDSGKIKDIKNASILAIFADSITTDHISPAGNISKTSPAAKYLLDRGIPREDFNSYGSRRGNHEVMMRGTFANIRIKNELLPGTEGGVTKHLPSGEQMSIYDAAMKYQSEKRDLVVIAGKEYGTGSSRDWAAKGTNLLGVKAVIAESFERIHRSNLVGMGVLPLVFEPGMDRKSLNLLGDEKFDIVGLEKLEPFTKVKCIIHRGNGKSDEVMMLARVDTENEVEYLKHGGILHKVIRDLK